MRQGILTIPLVLEFEEAYHATVKIVRYAPAQHVLMYPCELLLVSFFDRVAPHEIIEEGPENKARELNLDCKDNESPDHLDQVVGHTSIIPEGRQGVETLVNAKKILRGDRRVGSIIERDNPLELGEPCCIVLGPRPCQEIEEASNPMRRQNDDEADPDGLHVLDVDIRVHSDPTEIRKETTETQHQSWKGSSAPDPVSETVQPSSHQHLTCNLINQYRSDVPQEGVPEVELGDRAESPGTVNLPRVGATGYHHDERYEHVQGKDAVAHDVERVHEHGLLEP